MLLAKQLLSWKCIFFLPTIRAMLYYIHRENHFIALFPVNTVPKQLYWEYCLNSPQRASWRQQTRWKTLQKDKAQIQTLLQSICTLQVYREMNKKSSHWVWYSLWWHFKEVCHVVHRCLQLSCIYWVSTGHIDRICVKVCVDFSGVSALVGWSVETAGVN